MCTADAQPKISSLSGRLKLRERGKSYLNDTITVDLLNQLAEVYIYDNPDSALHFARQALQIARKLAHPSIAEARAANDIAKIYYVLGYYYPSLDASVDAFNTSSKLHYQNGIAASINIKGLIYLAQDKFDDALPAFKQAVSLSRRIKDSTKLAANLFDVGLTYDEKGLYEPAFANLNDALSISNKIKDWHIYLMTLNRLGETYYHSKNYDTALNYYRKVLSFKWYRDNWETSFAYSGMGQTYQAMGRQQMAISYAQKSFGYSAKMKASWDAERALNILAGAYAASGDYKNAYHYESILKNYADTLFNESKEREINYLHLKEKKAENLQLQKENLLNRQALREKELIIFIISAFVFILLILMVIVIRNSRQKMRLYDELQLKNTDIAVQKEEILKQKEELVKINRAKDQVFSVISHDLRGPFATIQSSLDMLRKGDLEEGDLPQVFENFQLEVGLISQMINNLLNWANSQQDGIKTTFERLDLYAAVDDILTIDALMANGKKQSLTHQKSGSSLWINADLNHVKIIIHNLIGNAVKFTPENGRIDIFYTDENEFAAIHIADNGIGITPEKMEKLFKVVGKSISAYGTNNEPGTGIGLMLIKQFTEENGGYMEIKSQPGKGSEFIVYFKKAGLSINLFHTPPVAL
jgi:signal transduction histidine kinase